MCDSVITRMWFNGCAAPQSHSSFSFLHRRIDSCVSGNDETSNVCRIMQSIPAVYKRFFFFRSSIFHWSFVSITTVIPHNALQTKNLCFENKLWSFCLANTFNFDRSTSGVEAESRVVVRSPFLSVTVLLQHHSKAFTFNLLSDRDSVYGHSYINQIFSFFVTETKWSFRQQYPKWQTQKEVPSSVMIVER